MKKTPSRSSPLPFSPALLEHHEPSLNPWLTSWRARNEVAPVLLLTGPSGCGKREIAHWLSQWMLCERSGPKAGRVSPPAEVDLFGSAPQMSASAPLRPCNECAACTRALQGTWVDFTEIAPEEGHSLKIDDFRGLKSTLGFGAFDSAYRVTLIRDADRLTPQAANSLLKVLEEPPPSFVFLLTASHASLLLPTLVSRCQRLHLLPPGEATLRRILEPEARQNGISEADLHRAIRQSQGNLHRARQGLEPEYWSRRKQILRFLVAPWTELESLLSASTHENSNLDPLLDHLDALSHEFIQWSYQPRASELDLSTIERELRPYLTDMLRRHGLARSRDFWLERALRSFQARHDSTLPLNRKLLTQELLIPWATGPIP